MKYFIFLTLVLIFSCEGIIDSNDVKLKNTDTSKNYNYIVGLIDGLNASTGDALNELMYISAIATDEAIEASSETAHDLLAAQKFDQYNSNVIRVYEKFQKLAKQAKSVEAEISSVMSTLIDLAADDANPDSALEDPETREFAASVNSSTLTKWQDVDTLYRAYARFFEGYAIYKLASNWDNAQLNYLPDSNFVTFTLFRHGLSVLDSAFSLAKDLPFTADPSELKTLQAMINFYRSYTNLNLFKHSPNNVDSVQYLKNAAINASWEDVGNLFAKDYKVKIQNSLIHQYSNSISTRMIFSSVFFEDDARLAIYAPESYRLQGSVSKDDSLYIAFDYDKNGFLQNKYTSSFAEVSIYHADDNTSLLNAEILYLLLTVGENNYLEKHPDDPGGQAVFPSDIVDKINNGRGFNTKRTDLTYELDNLPFDTSLGFEARKRIALEYLVKEYLAADFLEGTRFETLRRLGQKPYKDGASSNYVFPSKY